MKTSIHDARRIAKQAQLAFERGNLQDGCDGLATLIHYLNQGIEIAIGNEFDLWRTVVGSNSPPRLTRFMSNADNSAKSAAQSRAPVGERLGLLSGALGSIVAGLDTLIENEFKLEQEGTRSLKRF